jgi:glutathione synthase/RimK-type ligase-like ATP-grasp enzyme
VVFGKKVVYVLIRVPHESDFRCNISQGGDYFFIDFTDLPMNMQQDALTIIDRLNLFTG